MSIEAAAARTRAYLAGNVRDFNPTGQAMMDLMVLVQAYLAEHLPDDGEPLTAEWLESQRSTTPFFDGIFWMKCSAIRLLPIDGGWAVRGPNNLETYVTIRDRGDYRRLVRALKLEKADVQR